MLRHRRTRLWSTRRLALWAMVAITAGACDSTPTGYEPFDIRELIPQFVTFGGYCPDCDDLTEMQAMLIRDSIRRIKASCPTLGNDLEYAMEQGRIKAEPGAYMRGYWGAYWHDQNHNSFRGWISVDPYYPLPDSWALDRTLRHEIRHEQLGGGPASEGPAAEAEETCPSGGLS